jgi:hypothetical protein
MKFNRVIGETGIYVWKDGGWIKPYHLTVSSGKGTARQYFWRLKSAISMAEWVALIVGDAVTALENDGWRKVRLAEQEGR